MTQLTLKCTNGCGRIDADIGPDKCGNFATCAGHSTPVRPGRDVILTVVETGVTRVIDPLLAIQGKTPSAFAGLHDLTDTSVVEARVIPKEVPVEAPVFTPEILPDEQGWYIPTAPPEPEFTPVEFTLAPLPEPTPEAVEKVKKAVADKASKTKAQKGTPADTSGAATSGEGTGER